MTLGQLLNVTLFQQSIIVKQCSKSQEEGAVLWQGKAEEILETALINRTTPPLAHKKVDAVYTEQSGVLVIEVK